MRWWLKFARGAAFGLLPCQQELRSLKRRFRPYPTAIPPWTLEQGIRQIEALRGAGCDLRGKRVLEVGTGWQPILPLLYHLSGASEVLLVDLQRLMDRETFLGTAHHLREHSALIASRLGLSEVEVERALTLEETPDSLEAACRRFRFDYRAPYDLTRQELPPQSVDVVYSRTVLEHIPPDVLRRLLAALLPVLKRGGYACHTIDNSDHWSHCDQSISPVNFLRYSDPAFAWLCRFNPLDYQNRLRHSEYVQIFRELGYSVEWEARDICPRAMEALATLPLSGRFRGMALDDLATIDSYFLARRPAEKLDAQAVDTVQQPAAAGIDQRGPATAGWAT